MANDMTRSLLKTTLSMRYSIAASLAKTVIFAEVLFRSPTLKRKSVKNAIVSYLPPLC